MTFVMLAIPDAAGDDPPARKTERAKQDDERTQATRRGACRRNLGLPPQSRTPSSIVKELARATGHGPTKARTTLGENAVFLVLQDTLTRCEQTLAEARDAVGVELDVRWPWRPER